MDLKEISSALAVALTFTLFVPYIRGILNGSLRPHYFSWLIWGGGTLTVAFAQLAGGAGIGAWPIGVSGLITIYIAVLAYRRRSYTVVTRADWMFLLAAASAFPAWYASADPLWAVVILTAADLIGFGPTIRRAYAQPYEESLHFFALGALRNLLVVVALEEYSVTTVLFPAAVGIACLLLALLLALRRRLLAPSTMNGRSAAGRDPVAPGRLDPQD